MITTPSLPSDMRRVGIDTHTLSEPLNAPKRFIISLWDRFLTTRFGFFLMEHTPIVRIVAKPDSDLFTYLAIGLLPFLVGCLVLWLGGLFIGCVLILVSLPIIVASGVFYWAYAKSERRFTHDLMTRRELMNQHDVIDHVSAHALARAAEHAIPEVREAGWPDDQPLPARYMGVSLGTCHGVNVWATSEQPLYVLGPARSGKTTSVVVPLIMEAPGAVVATSSRRDIIDATYQLKKQGWTISSRQHTAPATVNKTMPLTGRANECFMFDPMNVAGSADPEHDESLPPRLNWNPIDMCADPVVARACAEAMVNTVGIRGDNQSWANAAIDIVQGLLLAAALDNKTLTDVYRWSMNAQACQNAAQILRRHTDNPTAGLWASSIEILVSEDSRIANSKMLGVTGAFSSLSLDQVRTALTPDPRRPIFDIDVFVQSNTTVYLLSGLRASHGASAAGAGVFLSMFLTQVRDAARRIAPTKMGGRLQPPLTLVLDEIANIEPWQELPQLFTAGTGEGIWPCAFFQSRKQAEDAYGKAEGQMWESSNKIVMGGLSIDSELREISILTGKRTVHHRDDSYSSSGGLFTGGSSSMRSNTVAVLEPDEVRRVPYGYALNLHTSHRPGFIGLIPYWQRGYEIAHV